MKLYLSSHRLGDEPGQLLELAGGAGEVAFVANALDGASKRTRRAVVQRGMEDLRRLSLTSTIVDLHQHFGDPDGLRSILAPYRILFVTGGNVFVLRRAMRRSGLDTLLLEAEGRDDLLYAAYSAGACVTGPTLEGFEKVDDPSVVPAGYPSDAPSSGLGIIDFSFIPHYESDHHESEAVAEVLAHHERLGLPYRALRDGEVFIRR